MMPFSCEPRLPVNANETNHIVKLAMKPVMTPMGATFFSSTFPVMLLVYLKSKTAPAPPATVDKQNAQFGVSIIDKTEKHPVMIPHTRAGKIIFRVHEGNMGLPPQSIQYERFSFTVMHSLHRGFPQIVQ